MRGGPGLVLKRLNDSGCCRWRKHRHPHRTNLAPGTKSHGRCVGNKPAGTRPSFAEYLNHDFTTSRSRVELQHGNLLPLTEHQLTITERNGYGRAEKRRTDVARTVVVAPA